ncbi:hypothetical protein COHA_008681 [Chlorella ohadii]|uniref:Serpin domain-containing protein n=1 Tax=Chlorella ohadii TaxID=2649997 RepID=A0AAD5DGA9_9CHLO|nr:hypothetical protein COHA_008681 [Chlorella ohadii]
MGAAQSHPAGDLASSINGFGHALFSQVAAQGKPGQGGGLFLSPYGVAQALGMLLNGVAPGGDSFRQLQSVVFGGSASDGDSLEGLNSQLLGLSQALVKPPTDDLTVADANSAWLALRYRLQARYAATLKDAFGAEAAPLQSAAVVNGWVDQATRGKITEIIDEGIARQAAVILVNAIYFKGLWQHAFKKASTHPLDWTPLQHSAAPLQAAMMFQIFKGQTAVQVATALPATTAGGSQLQCAAVQLPYRGGEYSAVAAMPLLAHLPAGATAPGGATPAPSQHWRRLPGTDVKVWLPRFEVEFGTSLVDALRALGLSAPFAGGDITQIAEDEQGRPIGDLQVSDVIHKVYIKVDEEGTEAAAATAVVMLRAAMPMHREEIELKFDRPFVFAVVHGPTGLALFAGEVYKPEAWTA